MGETCEGCVHWLQDTCTLAEPLDISDGHPVCDIFQPGLQLRQVLALEKLAGCVDSFGKGGAFNVFDQAKDS